MPEEKTIPNLPTYYWGDDPTLPFRHMAQEKKDRFVKRYGILLVCACLFTLYTIILSALVHVRAVKATEIRMNDEFDQRMAEWQAERYFLSGEASRDMFINQEITAGAKLIAKEENDQVKGTKLGVAIARAANQNYPATIQAVAEQPNQFMFYSDANTYTQHDWDLSESMIRPFIEQGKLPNGLTENMVFFEWNGSSGTARDSYEITTSMQTWRYSG